MDNNRHPTHVPRDGLTRTERAEAFRSANLEMRQEYLRCNLRIQEAQAASDPRAERRARSERERIASHFIEVNTPLAHSIASKWRSVDRGSDLGDEHTQAALLGLWEAFAGTTPAAVDGVLVGDDGTLRPLGGWDPAQAPFASWAANFVEGRTRRSVRSAQPDTSGLSYRTFSLKPQVDQARSALLAETGRTPSQAEVAARAGVTLETVQACDLAKHVSLDTPVGDDRTLGDVVATSVAATSGASALAGQAEQLLTEIVADHHVQDVMAFLLREGIVTDAPRSRISAADTLATTRSIVDKAMERIGATLPD